jgi:ribose 5-phosphate isomerase RpiB
MTPAAGEIEQIVREVLRRLDAAGGTPEAKTSEASPPSNDKELELTARVIALADVEACPKGIATISVMQGAVLTPAARDYLNQRGVTIRRRVTSGGTQPPPAAQSLVLGLAETEFCPASLMNYLANRGIAVQQLAHAGLRSVVREMCDAVALGGQRGLLLTGETAAALCLANRRQGVRAALASDSSAAEKAMQSIAANILVIDPMNTTAFQLQRMAERLCHAILDPAGSFASVL